MYCNVEMSHLNIIRLSCQQVSRLVWAWPAYLRKGSLGRNTLLTRSCCRVFAVARGFQCAHIAVKVNIIIEEWGSSVLLVQCNGGKSECFFLAPTLILDCIA